jgi:carboxylesterase type B
MYQLKHGSFLSIPFAQPPVGDLRFAPPKAFNASYTGGSIQVMTNAPACIQFGDEFIEYISTSEDW